MNSIAKECPVCGEGSLTRVESFTKVRHNGLSGQIPTIHSECDICGSAVADAEESRANKRAMVAFRKKAEDLLSGNEIKRIRTTLGLTQRLACTLLGGGPVAFSKYENDDLVQSEPMDGLLRVLDAYPDAIGVLAKARGVSPDELPSHQKRVRQPFRISLRQGQHTGDTDYVFTVALAHLRYFQKTLVDIASRSYLETALEMPSTKIPIRRKFAQGETILLPATTKAA